MRVRGLVSVVSIAVTLAAPAIAFAQSNGPLTRAQVRAELVQIEDAGYHPGDGDGTTYPKEIQEAESRVARTAVASKDYGDAMGGTSASGAAAHQADIPGLRPIYSGQ